MKKKILEEIEALVGKLYNVIDKGEPVKGKKQGGKQWRCTAHYENGDIFSYEVSSLDVIYKKGRTVAGVFNTVLLRIETSPIFEDLD